MKNTPCGIEGESLPKICNEEKKIEDYFFMYTYNYLYVQKNVCKS